MPTRKLWDHIIDMEEVKGVSVVKRRKRRDM